MAFPKMDDIRQLSDQEIADEIAATKRRLFDLRFQKATRQLESGFHQFKQERHRLAQLMTLQRQRQLAPQTDSGASPAAASAEAQ
jgi:large subunit ribosomal protein L29